MALNDRKQYGSYIEEDGLIDLGAVHEMMKLMKEDMRNTIATLGKKEEDFSIDYYVKQNREPLPFYTVAWKATELR
jgi:hypothetical protein